MTTGSPALIAQSGSAGTVETVLKTLDGAGVPIELLLQIADSFAYITLAAIGLAVIFGMVGVINLAHGEFILIGAYATTLSVNVYGLPLPIAMVFGSLLTGLFGIVVERTIVRRLYGRLLDTMIATFGLGLIITQGVRIVYGNTIDSVSTPFGAVPGYTYSAYRVFLAVVAIAVLVAIYLLFTRTEFGVKARATIQDPDTARAMGVDTDRMYMLTFGLGSALAGLTGALYAPMESMVPSMGNGYLVESFVAVVVGGSSALVGTLSAGGLLGTIRGVFASEFGTFVAKMALLATAILVIRFLPGGLSGLYDSLTDRVQEE
ncbi:MULTISPECIES: urea ABC transporter, permease protein UrtB [unclassified Halorhabdus]|uniref:urea ABC transporter, permease protein UrtB n=1 Tax=unclassified Halorhabdus TaxID=2621901 RepID=UPI0023DB0E0F|nr:MULTISPECIES: urea ABC transporter, permease protein UrtB [unclassified Halorhabdus]WEL18375.1 Branched-chain amino acid ABC-type transport system, permease component [Halorhabdus sp. SVX81]WEL22261.1 Branched-chain amino acid ABC-type transport system, permease component [Halorhabdus sp. BNX81]